MFYYFQWWHIARTQAGGELPLTIVSQWEPLVSHNTPASVPLGHLFRESALSFNVQSLQCLREKGGAGVTGVSVENVCCGLRRP